ncbi:phBC6A51 family helix-turn-helix protein [Brevibacillus borstelensis]|uniref:phBC6A51 family helix-turn-helix protein n=1 Tax=Brevibacillus borstelensis TaxID=45462 RepID=UPI00287FDE29|nr:phBC6A51 family helix-turn-helix protein [Brevibacillus borstelensis]WNF06380.1 phBC6A51 family helix-turn-helix protein [Brevibacillus borstelensis]
MNNLTPEQYTAIQYLAQPDNGGKTVTEIAQECGVSVSTLYAWRRKPDFQREIIAETRRNLVNVLPKVNAAMTEAAVDDKNAAAAKLIYQQLGLLTDKVEVEAKASGEVPDIDELKRMVAEIDS